MNISNERKLAARAKKLGESADASAFGELAELTRSESPLVRRLAASALGKLAGIIEPESAVKTLHPLLSDAHPQVRQYAAKALGAFGVHAKEVLPDLRDLYKIGMLKKQQLYQQQGKKLISLYPDDKPRLREVLLGKLTKLK